LHVQPRVNGAVLLRYQGLFGGGIVKSQGCFGHRPLQRARLYGIMLGASFSVCTLAFPVAADAEADRDLAFLAYKGRAFYTGDASPSYTEHYVLRMRGGEPLTVKTEYRDRSGALQAERSLDFDFGRAARSPWSPHYRFRNRATGYEEGAEPKPDGLHVFMREATGEPLREKILKVPAPVVVDGGFVPFVRAHWDTLMTGARVTFHFVAVSRLDWFVLDLYRDSSADRDGTVAFVAAPRHAALRLIVDPTRVWFDPATRRMVEFQGRSNIHDTRGKAKPVRLLYTPMRPVSSAGSINP
jgi:hypothetical protein